MYQLPKSIQALVEEFNRLPGIGPKTSERFALYLLQQPTEEVETLAKTLTHLKARIIHCSNCHALTETNPCTVCRDRARNPQLVCVVAESSQIISLEKTGVYQGLYFVLGGVLNPIEGITPDRLNVKSLVERVKKSQPKIVEIILALNPNVEGESTSIYLKKLVGPYVGKVTRLARGLPMGGDLEYADEITLASALKGRN
jgi:recombination protein RecR